MGLRRNTGLTKSKLALAFGGSVHKKSDISYSDTDISYKGRMIYRELIKLVYIILIHTIVNLICFSLMSSVSGWLLSPLFFNEAVRLRFEYEV